MFVYPRGVHTVPVMSIDAGRYLDLLGVVVLALLPVGLIPLIGDGVVRFLITIPLLVLLPGYAVAAAFYPESGRTDDRDGGMGDGRQSSDETGIGFVGRLGLSMATSIAIVSLITLAANFVVGIYVFPILISTVAVTVIGALAAAIRRRVLPADRSAGVYPHRRVADGLRRYFVAGGRSFGSERPFEATTRRGVLLNGLIVVSVLLLFSSVGFAFFVGPQDDPSSEFYLQSQQNGNWTITDTTDGVQAAELDSLRFVVANHEGDPTTYTAVVQVQRTDGSGNATQVISEQRYSQRVGDGETWRQQVGVGQQSGSNVRAVFLLYKGEDTSGDAYRRLTLDLSADGSAALRPPAAERSGAVSG